MKTLFSTIFKKNPKKDDSIKNKAPVAQIYNRSALSSHLDTLVPSDLQEMALVFIRLDHFEKNIKQSGQKVANAILANFKLEVSNASIENKVVAQWCEQSLILACPKTSIEQATVIGKKIKRNIQDKTWKKNVKASCSIGIAEIADESLFSLISRIQTKIDKQRGNSFFVDKAKAKQLTPNHQHHQASTMPAKTVTSASPKAQNEINTPTPEAAVNKTICNITGALNQESFTHYVSNLPPELKQITKVIVIDIANLANLTQQYGQNRADEISQKVAHEIFMKSGALNTLGTWNKKEFLLTSTNANSSRTEAFAAEIESAIENRTWLTSIEILISTEAFELNNHDVMSLSTASIKDNTADSDAKNRSHDLQAMTCASTGALNQAGITSFLEQCNSTVLQEMSVIFIALDSIDNTQNTKITESVSQHFVNYINKTCSLSIITRLSIKEYLLICPKTTIEQATQMTEEIKTAVTLNDWPDGVLLSCKTEVYDKNWHESEQDPAPLSVAQEFVADNIVRIFAA